VSRAHQPREIEIVPGGAGLRLDRYLARWFRHYSRAAMARAIREGLITDAQDRPLRASRTVRAGDRIRVWIPELAAAEPPPPFPEILHEDDRLVALAKPPGMMCHPAGARFVWGLIGLCKERWPDRTIDLVHRLDADTSGVILLTKDVDANRRLKSHLHDDGTVKAYDAIVRGRPDWAERVLDGPIGPAGGEVRIQMAVRADGLPSLTLATRGETHDSPLGPLTVIHCRIRTGRTHQIRVHLSDAGLPLIGDRLYGPRPTLFLDWRDSGRTDALVAEAGAPRHALHARRIRVPHPDGGWLDVTCPWPDDMRRWWERPQVLPLDAPDEPAAP
jgi:23S rRNA pseudouridine1911/1915/1917 synthase